MNAGVKLDGETDIDQALRKMKEIERQKKEQREINVQLSKDLIEKAIEPVLAEFENDNPKVWTIFLLDSIGYSLEKEEKELVEGGKASLKEIKYFLARSVAKHYVWNLDDPKDVLKRLNENLKEVGLDLLPDPMAELPEPVEAPPSKSLEEILVYPEEDRKMVEENKAKGKTLAEVFAEEDAVSTETVLQL